METKKAATTKNGAEQSGNKIGKTEKAEKDCVVNKVAALMKLMNENQFSTLEIEEKDFRLKVEKYTAAAMVAPAAPVANAPIVPATPVAAPAVNDENLIPIKSPIVGTFYASPSPETAAFIAVGDKVNPETIVCIIEAMKIMNEIKAELSGTIETVLVANGDPIEYGQPLFLVRK